MNTFFHSAMGLLISISTNAGFALFTSFTSFSTLPTVSLAKTATKPSVDNKAFDFKVETPADDYKYMTDDQFAEMKKEAVKKNAERQPQQARLDFADPNVKFSSEYLNLQAKLIGGDIYNENLQIVGKIEGVKTSDELAVLINDANNDEKYSKLPNDAKFIAAALATMKPYQGLAFRARPLFSKNNIVHAYMIAGLRQAASGINVFLPTPQWESGFQYFSEPLATKYYELPIQQYKKAPEKAEERLNTYIEDEKTFFLFVNYEVVPSMDKYANRLKALVDASESKDFKPFYFDNRLVVSTARFVADQDQILMIDGPALRLALASVLGTRSGLHASLAYTWTNLFKAVDAVAKNWGFQAAFNVDLTTAEVRNRAIRQPGLFILKSPQRMEKAYNDLQESVRQTYLAWKIIGNLPTNNPAPNQIISLLDPRVIQPFSRSINTSFSNVVSLFDVQSSGGNIRSAVISGEAVPVNLYNFFHGDTIPKDLKDFMPSSYVQGTPEFTTLSDGRQGRLARVAGGSIRNYLQGSPNGWNTGLYGKYFPTVNSNKDVQKAARVLSQAWGGWLIGLPLSAMVL